MELAKVARVIPIHRPHLLQLKHRVVCQYCNRVLTQFVSLYEITESAKAVHSATIVVVTSFVPIFSFMRLSLNAFSPFGDIFSGRSANK